MEIKIYPEQINGIKYDTVEIEAMKDVDGNVEPCEDDDDPSFYSVFIHDIKGGRECVADLPTFKLALDLRNAIYHLVYGYRLWNGKKFIRINK